MNDVDLKLAYRLLCASLLAYGIKKTGTGNGRGALETDLVLLPTDLVIDRLIREAGFQPDTVRTYQPASSKGIDAFLYGETHDEVAIIAFRGTLPPAPPREATDIETVIRTIEDWGTNFDAQPEQAPDNLMLPGRVHKGWAEALTHL